MEDTGVDELQFAADMAAAREAEARESVDPLLVEAVDQAGEGHPDHGRRAEPGPDRAAA